MKKINLIILSMAFVFSANSAAAISKYEKTIKKSEVFLKWLSNNEKKWGQCVPIKSPTHIQLCDHTEINIAEAQHLFKKTPSELIDFIKAKKINLEIYCQEKRETNIFKNWCSLNKNSKFFKEVSSLHGQYIPYDNTIALHSDSNFGSLVHEYFHYLQYQNRNKIFGKAYKRERIAIQKEIIARFDEIILEATQFEKSGKKEKAIPLLTYAKQLSDLLMRFGYWQKIIDERNLFLLYINFSSELGIAEEDIILAKKNMAFLCKDEKIKSLISSSECL